MERGNRKARTGVVVSDKMDKTVVVEIERTFRHPFYQKVMRTSKRLKAHDEKNECKTGDLVEIRETRPLSRGKCWIVIKVLGKGKLNRQDLPKKREAKEEVSDTTA